MVAAERTHIRRDRFTAAFGVAMMERFIVVQIGIQAGTSQCSHWQLPAMIRNQVSSTAPGR